MVNVQIKTFCATLQESISDFYWYYSGKDVIEVQGQRNFSKAIEVAKQVFNTLTEYIQVSHVFHLFYFNSEHGYLSTGFLPVYILYIYLPIYFFKQLTLTMCSSRVHVLRTNRV